MNYPDEQSAPGSHSWATFLDAAHERVLGALAQAPTHTGHFVEGGQWKLVPVSQTSFWTDSSYDHGNWTSGFWTGALLHLEELGGPTSHDVAIEVAAATAGRAVDETTHDVGFMFWPSAALLADRFAADGDEESSARWARVALTGAETLARRHRPGGGYLQAFGGLDDPKGQPTSTIDTMMNLPLLWWAARRFDREDLYTVALSHARATARDMVRSDGSTYQLVLRDDQGKLVSQGTFQGSGDESCWTRGQAWAVHGFIDAYLKTGEDEFADIAVATTDFWASQADLGELPPYDLTERGALRDASAGAILASGLADAVSDSSFAARLKAHERLEDTLSALGRDALFASAAGIVGRSTYSAPHNWGVDGALPYGDYFYLRALSVLANG